MSPGTTLEPPRSQAWDPCWGDPVQGALPEPKHPGASASQPTLGPAWVRRIHPGSLLGQAPPCGVFWDVVSCGLKQKPRVSPPLLGAWNTFLAGRDGAGQDQSLAALGVFAPCFIPVRSRVGSKAGLTLLSSSQAGSFLCFIPSRWSSQGLGFQLGNCDTVTFSCWNYLPGSFDVGSGPAAGLGSGSGVSKLQRGSSGVALGLLGIRR